MFPPRVKLKHVFSMRCKGREASNTADGIRWAMNSANGISLRIQQNDERSASARAAHINRETALARRRNGVNGWRRRCCGPIVNHCFRLANRLTDSVLRGEGDNESRGGKTEERAGVVGQRRTANVALEFAVRARSPPMQPTENLSVIGSFRATAV
jgi:hypothetical protein